MPRGWSNLTISFKQADERDMERKRFASSLPNCTNDIKRLLDEMMAGGYRSFEEWVRGFGKRDAGVAVEVAGVSQEITGDVVEGGVVEVDAGQFF